MEIDESSFEFQQKLAETEEVYEKTFQRLLETFGKPVDKEFFAMLDHYIASSPEEHKQRFRVLRWAWACSVATTMGAFSMSRFDLGNGIMHMGAARELAHGVCYRFRVGEQPEGEDN